MMPVAAAVKASEAVPVMAPAAASLRTPLAVKATTDELGSFEVLAAAPGPVEVAKVAWETAEAATVGHPPGPTPAVSVPPDVAGVRIVVQSGERRDVVWTVPEDPAEVAALIFGCHIPGHYAKGMWVPVRVAPDG